MSYRYRVTLSPRGRTRRVVGVSHQFEHCYGAEWNRWFRSRLFAELWQAFPNALAISVVEVA
jgi:hypothetical protein